MPDCSSLIVSEETGDYIIEYNSLYFEQIQRQDGVCISCINDTWCILYTNYPGSRNINIQQGYYSVPKLYGLMDTTSFDASGITATLNQPLLNVRGQGVLIGFLDTGIDYLREDFKASAKSAIGSITKASLPLSSANGHITFKKAAQPSTFSVIPALTTSLHATFKNPIPNGRAARALILSARQGRISKRSSAPKLRR